MASDAQEESIEQEKISKIQEKAQESVKEEVDFVEITNLPSEFFENSDDEEVGSQLDNTEEIEAHAEEEAKPTVARKRYKKEFKTPRTREQPRRANKKELVIKRYNSSPYTLAQEEEMEALMKEMGWIKCHPCNGLELSSFKELNAHFRSVHNCYAYIYCCNGKRRIGTAAFDHLVYHQNQGAYKCPLCEKTFRSRSNIRGHIKSIHTGPDSTTYTCEECGKVMYSKGKLTDHMKTHVKPVKCSYCGKGENLFFDSSKFLFLNLRSLFPGFPNNPHLRRHVERLHEIANRVVCDICGKWFSNHCTLNIHLVRHKSQINKKTCPHCGKQVADLTQHVNVVHLGTRRGGIIRIPGLDSQGRPLEETQ